MLLERPRQGPVLALVCAASVLLQPWADGGDGRGSGVVLQPDDEREGAERCGLAVVRLAAKRLTGSAQHYTSRMAGVATDRAAKAPIRDEDGAPGQIGSLGCRPQATCRQSCEQAMPLWGLQPKWGRPPLARP